MCIVLWGLGMREGWEVYRQDIGIVRYCRCGRDTVGVVGGSGILYLIIIFLVSSCFLLFILSL